MRLVFKHVVDLADVDQVPGQYAGVPIVSPRLPAEVLSGVEDSVQIKGVLRGLVEGEFPSHW